MKWSAFCGRSKIAALVLLAWVHLPSGAIAANDCGCPTIPAFGKGNTSCSASETAGRCVIDYNLFSPQVEQVAAKLLDLGGLGAVQLPPPGASIQALAALSNDEKPLVDAVLTYLMVGTAHQVLDFRVAVEGSVRGIVQVLSPLRKDIASAFQGLQMKFWMGATDAQLKGDSVPAPREFADRRVILAPGCLEVQVGNLWTMFKASWTPLRIRPRCRR